MTASPWVSLAALNSILWWPGGWPVTPSPELLATVLLVGAATAGRRTLIVLLPVALALVQADRSLRDRLPPDRAGLDVLVRGQVCDFPRSGGRATRFVLHVDPASRAAGLPARVQLAWYLDEAAPEAGESWQLKLRLRPVRGLASPGAADTERMALVQAQGARGYVRPSPLNRRLSASGWRCPTLLPRRWLATRLRAALGDHAAVPYLLAVTVGVRDQLSPTAWDRLRRTGTAHLMAISGLHVGLVAGSAMLLGRVLGYLLVRAGLPLTIRRASLCLGLVAATLYAGLAGFALPTRRALLMLFAWALPVLVRRRVTVWSTLAVALWLVLLTDGLAVLTAGFWLSFGAVLALLTATLACGTGPPRVAPLRWARGLLGAQWRVFVGLAPVALLCFGELAPAAPLANLFAVPLFAVAIMPLAMLGMLLLAAGLPAAPLHWAADLLALLVDGLAWLDHGAWAGGFLPFWLLPFAGLASLACLWPRPLPARPILVGLFVLLVPFGRSAPATGELHLTVLDVGQGLAVVVRTNTHALIYDAGPAYGQGDAGRSSVLPALRAAGISRLDAVVVSHGDLDHAGGAASVHAAFPRAAVLTPDALGLPATACRAGQSWHWDGVEFRFLHPHRAVQGGSDNDRSCVLLINGAGGSALLPGDIGRRIERRLVAGLRAEPVDVVVAAHHGSDTSSASPFVRTVRAAYVVFAAGYGNRWGFPRPAVTSRWRRSGACVLDTGRDGALSFASRDGALRLLSRFRAESSYAWRVPAAAIDCQPRGPRL